jgi:hypothetical protein
MSDSYPRGGGGGSQGEVLSDINRWVRYLYLDRGWRGPIEFPLTLDQRRQSGIAGDHIFLCVVDPNAGFVHVRVDLPRRVELADLVL